MGRLKKKKIITKAVAKKGLWPDLAPAHGTLEEQQTALKDFLGGKYIFFILPPTGFGKSFSKAPRH